MIVVLLTSSGIPGCLSVHLCIAWQYLFLLLPVVACTSPVLIFTDNPWWGRGEGSHFQECALPLQSKCEMVWICSLTSHMCTQVPSWFLFPLSLSSLLYPLQQSYPAHGWGWGFLPFWSPMLTWLLSLLDSPSVCPAHWRHLLIFSCAVKGLSCRLLVRLQYL